ncbi:MAG: hypothetical protein AAF632_24975, partial [Bacteroidota bacterium]
TVALYRLMETIGYEVFLSSFIRWMDENVSKPSRFIDLYQRWLEKVPEIEKVKVQKLFETTEPLTL